MHVTGKTQYLDDLPELAGTVYARVYYSKIAHGTIKNIDISKAAAMPGVLNIISYKDIPGENQIGGIIPDEPLLAEQEVHFIGMPILIVLAESEIIAHKACKVIEAQITEKEIITDPIEAYNRKEFLSKPITFKMGDPTAAFANCTYVFEGTAESGGQEHVYLEPQGGLCYSKW